MNKKKIILYIGLIFIFLLLGIVLAPWEMRSNKFEKDCESYCEDIKNTPRYGLDCMLPAGGCFDACIGIKVGEKCSERSKCFKNCKTTCFGLNTSLCAPSVFERKINFITGEGDK